MSYLPTQSLCLPQRDIDNAPIRTFALGQNVLFKDFFKAPIMPNVYTTFPRTIQTAKEKGRGRVRRSLTTSSCFLSLIDPLKALNNISQTLRSKYP
jgi:hypothetical protein